MKNRAVLLIFALIILNLIILNFSWIKVATTETLDADSLSFNYPLAVFEKQGIDKGVYPHWNPYAQAGTVHTACPFASSFYPPHWFNYLPNITLGININFLFHWFILLIGTWLFFRRFAPPEPSAIACLLTTIALPLLYLFPSGYLGHIYGLVWVPLIFYFVHKDLDRPRYGNTVIAGLLIGLQVANIASYALIDTIIPLVIFLVSLLGVRHAFGRLIILGVVSGIFAAFRLLPWLYYAGFSPRTIGMSDFLFSTMGSIHPYYLINFVFPGLLTAFPDGIILTAYRPTDVPIFSALIIMMAMTKKVMRDPMSRFFLILALFTSLIIYGGYSPVFLICYKFIPGFSTLSHPNLDIWLTMVAIGGLLCRMWTHPQLFCMDPKKIFKRMALLSCVVFVLTSIVALFIHLESDAYVYFESHRSEFSVSALVNRLSAGVMHLDLNWYSFRTMCAQANLWAIPLTIAGWSFFVFAFRKLRDPKSQRVALVILSVIISADHIIHNPERPNLTIDPHEYFKVDPVIERLADHIKAEDGLWRVYPVGGKYDTKFFRFNTGHILNIENIKGATGFILGGYAEYMHMISDLHPRPLFIYAQLYGKMDKLDSPLLHYGNVKYFISDRPLVRPFLKLHDKSDSIYIYQNVKAKPRLFVPDVLINGGDNPLERLHKLDMDDPRTYYFKENDAAPRETVIENPAKISNIRRINVNEIRATYISDKKSWVLLSETFSPGWKAVLGNGETIIPNRANNFMQAYLIPAGAHDIRFIFYPKRMNMGITITLIWLTFLLLLYVPKILNRKENEYE